MLFPYVRGNIKSPRTNITQTVEKMEHFASAPCYKNATQKRLLENDRADGADGAVIRGYTVREREKERYRSDSSG